jgi:hypothetical protein
LREEADEVGRRCWSKGGDQGRLGRDLLGRPGVPVVAETSGEGRADQRRPGRHLRAPRVEGSNGKRWTLRAVAPETVAAATSQDDGDRARDQRRAYEEKQAEGDG